MQAANGINASIGRRERRRAATEQRIMDAALHLFSQQGFATTTVDAIAAAADIGKGTFFNYFPAKEHLVIAFGARLVGKLVVGAGTMPANVPIREIVRSVAHRLVAEWRGNQRLLRSIIGAVLSNEMLAERFSVLLATGRRHVALLIAEGQRRGELRSDIPSDDLARLLQQSVFGAQVLWSLRPPAKLTTAVDETLEIFWSGVEAVPSRSAQAARRRRR